MQGACTAGAGAGGTDSQPVRGTLGSLGMGGLGIRCLVTTHAEVPPLLGSSQDGSGSQHEAGCIRKTVEGGLGQGETHPCVPRPALDGVYWPQPARACNRFLTDLLSIRNKRTRSGTVRVGLNLSSPGPPDSIGAPIPPWRFVLLCCSPGGPNGYLRFTF